MFKNAVRIGAIGGVSIRLDPSWFALALLFVVAFWGQFSARYAHPGAVAAGLAVATTILFFASVLAHELAHALEAQHRGVEVGGITLFLFGGVTETRFDVRRPFDEFALSAVGPWASFVLAAGFGLVATGAQEIDLRGVADVAGLLGWINLVLGVFNLLPGAPLDGGRVLRSAVWKLTGDRERAVRFAGRVGQLIGLLIVLFAVYQATAWTRIAEGLFNGFIGWFLFRAASAEHEHADVAALLQGHHAGSLVGAERTSLPAHTPVPEAVDRIRRSGSRVHPVEQDGITVGIVRASDLRGVNRSRRAGTAVGEVMHPIAELPTVGAHVSLADALEDLTPFEAVLVVDDDGPVGLLTTDDVEAAVARLRSLRGDRRRVAGETP